MVNKERSKRSPKQYKYMTRYVTWFFNTLRKTVMQLGIIIVTGGQPLFSFINYMSVEAVQKLSLLLSYSP